jgi:two-component system, cell cycle response regulator PopA
LRIVVRSTDVRGAREGQERLAGARIEATAIGAPAAPWRAAPEGEDVLVINAMKHGLAEAEEFAAAACAEGRAPLCVLAGLAADAPPRPGQIGGGALTGAVALDATPALLAAQVRAAARAGVAEEECARRMQTATQLGARAPARPEPRKLKALYIGAPSPLFLSLESSLAREGGLVAAAFTSYCGFDHLHDEEFDAVVLNGANDPQTAISLCAALRRNANLHHLPTLVITAPDDANTANASIERGASAVVETNAPCAPALGWLMEAVRRERRRRSAEHDLRALRDIMGDARTGLMRREAFTAHLERMADDHHRSGRRLGLTALRVAPAPGARKPAPQAWKRGMSEVASLAGRLIRDADCGAVLAGDVIAVALPMTDIMGARRTAERIASVADCSAFASGEGEAGPLSFEQSIAELAPGESGRGLLARTLAAYDLESMQA